ncbi:ImmA/IrrE family metallo-endopeptidase [Calidithermus chliarophilus]|uniref:ImmA/IrrE family metallo-endopeptidase n=1 Tax=Calidithermus chliarophilus TaxID=52023 RepID=UPI00040C0B0B
MNTPLWVSELAAAFWEQAGEEEPFPRDLRRGIALGLPLSVVTIPALSVGGVRRWLAHNGVNLVIDAPEHNLRACLVARFGRGIVFLDAADPPDEQRFSLAHEVAHYLRDYWKPRQEAVKGLGPGVLEVFDGRRAPSPAEQVYSLLARIPVEAHLHLMERSPEGFTSDLRVRRAEAQADRLAFELLAPAEHVLAGSFERNRLMEVLCRVYGLPRVPAQQYASTLLPEGEHSPWLLRLGLRR